MSEEIHMYKFASQQLTVKEIYQQGFTFLRMSLRHVWLLMVLGMACLLAAQAVGHYSGIFDPLKPISASFARFTNLSLRETLFVAVLLAALIANIYFVNVAMHRMYVFGSGVTGSIKNSLTFVFHKMPTLIFLNIVVFILVFFGMLLYIIPGVILIIFFVFSVPAVLFENKRTWRALARSCSLVWGRWWQTLAVVFLPWALLFLSAIVPSQIKNIFLANAISLVLFSVLMPLLYAFVLVQYRNLNLRKSKAKIR